MLLLELFLTILINSIVFAFPVLIFRFFFQGGKPIQSRKKAILINIAFFSAGTVVLVILHALLGSFDDGYRFQLGIFDVTFLGLDYFLLTFRFDQKRNCAPSPSTFSSAHAPVDSICHKCRSVLPDGAKFCPECGEAHTASLRGDSFLCPCCGKAIKSSRFCPLCGHKLPDTDSVVPPTLIPVDSPPDDQDNGVIKMSTGALILVAFAFFIIVFVLLSIILCL